MVPKFFRNAKDVYKKNSSNKEVTHTNKNPNKKKVSEKVIKYLERKFDREIEFYEFCLQRLQRQWDNVRTISRFSQDNDWPDRLSDNVGDDDDYVLLWKDASHDYVIWRLRITMKYNVMLIVPTIITSLTQNKNKIK